MNTQNDQTMNDSTSGCVRLWDISRSPKSHEESMILSNMSYDIGNFILGDPTKQGERRLVVYVFHFLPTGVFLALCHHHLIIPTCTILYDSILAFCIFNTFPYSPLTSLFFVYCVRAYIPADDLLPSLSHILRGDCGGEVHIYD